MPISYHSSTQQANNLNTALTQLNATKQELIKLTSKVQSNWSAEEIRYFEEAINQITSKIDSISFTIDNLQSAIRRVKSEIEKEEKEKLELERQASANQCYSY